MNGFDISTISGIYVGSNKYNAIYKGSTLIFRDYSAEYLTFIATESGTFKFSGNSINYSLDGGETWVELASDTDTPTISIGDKILWKASLTPDEGIGTFSSSGNFTVEGNVMSLLYGDDFVGQTSLSGKDYVFYCLFSDCTGMTSAENLSLPATTLATYCYTQMFYGCTSLTTAPELPATTLADYCYKAMFRSCSSLTTAPALPATTLAIYCYNQMFHSCSALTTAPELPATTLLDSCYRQMFESCINLVTPPSMAATIVGDSCCRQMFRYCSNLTSSPILYASILVFNCYYNMFRDCPNLSTITCYATDISATNCTSNWLNNVASTGTFVKAASMTSWTTGSNGIPSGWTVQTATS